MNSPRVVVIVPAHNEEASLPSLVSDFASLTLGFDVVIVDDGSTDQTRITVSNLNSPRVHLLSLSCNLGVGGAVQTGMKFAVRRGYDVAVQVDGDGQHPPSEIPRVVEALIGNKWDMAIGSRFLAEDPGFRSSVIRRIGIRLFSSILSVLCHQRITDATSGFRAWSRPALELLSEEYPEDYPEVEAVLMLHRAGMRIGEVPVRMARRSAGKSTIGAFRAVTFLVKVPLAIVMNLIRKPRPIAAGSED